MPARKRNPPKPHPVGVDIFKAADTIQCRLPVFTLHWNGDVLAFIAAALAEIPVVEHERVKAVLGKALGHFVKAAIGGAAQPMSKNNCAGPAFTIRHI